MTAPRVAAVLLCALLSLAASALAAGNGCSGGGRPRPDEGGIGGTGIAAMRPEDEGGIGGTGISATADTGIIGTVTGFGSICVGGVEIHYSADTPVRIDGNRAAATQLAVGQVVEVTANGSGAEVSAQEISVRYVVSGPVTRNDAASNEIAVMGQHVQLTGATRSATAGAEQTAVATAFPAPALVHVSGFRRSDGVIVASRVARGDATANAQLTGPVTKLDSGMLWVAGTAVRAARPEVFAVGDEVHVVGHWDGSAIDALSVASMPNLPFDGHVGRVDIEGFARPVPAGGLQIGAYSVDLPPAAAQEAQKLSGFNTRIRIQAVIQNRHVIVERIGVLDELPALPPLPPRDAGAAGGKSGDARNANPAPPDQPGFGDADGSPPRGGGGDMRPNDGGRFGGPHDLGGPHDHGWSDRPPAQQPPERPSLPQIPHKPSVPQLPPRPGIPDRPPLPERPPIPQPPDRPQLPSRPDRPMVPKPPDVPRRP